MECSTIDVNVQVKVNVYDVIKELSDEQKTEIAKYCCNSINKKDVKIIVSEEKYDWKTYLVLLINGKYCIVFGKHKSDVESFLNYRGFAYLSYMPFEVPLKMKHIKDVVIYGTKVVEETLDEISKKKFDALWRRIIPNSTK